MVTVWLLAGGNAETFLAMLRLGGSKDRCGVAKTDPTQPHVPAHIIDIHLRVETQAALHQVRLSAAWAQFGHGHCLGIQAANQTTGRGAVP